MDLEPDRLVGRVIVAAEWVQPSAYSDEDTLRLEFADGCVVLLKAESQWEPAYMLIEVERTRAGA